MSTPLVQQFPSLAQYPPSLLKDLLSSPELTEAFLFSLPEVKELAAEVEKLGRENDEIASMDELIALRDATAQSYAYAEGLKRKWTDIEKAQANLYQRNRPSFLHLRLRHSLTAQDELSEKIASAFIEGRSAGASMPGSRVDSPWPGAEGTSTPVSGGDRNQSKAIEDFINEFKAARKTYHKRAIWAERWSRGEVAWRDD
ncbi:hypothetical protein L486_01583 [Kwoniella mangroviensis CBS 10435]|uniref:VPS37 C-terminal domain-containing protein n=1 Tax=Kwoniella mangroviensis CBS 10435 TaxID=1331196 RepID=A0A1B9J2E9_9TREE|nr:uncharacterized protein I203_03751 [Kwoniella mangroviensis CBS 8507]OCF61919.1 hypothetical protein L486_01583 [Kwoniella mangroviensis CBS 10435]OCF67067.1 hypothetical protein I203_03751 [Kwoniella mangroviensis CBS 8507]OCF77938.1 hypothetical protein I204_01942 [Kwoniella mangroviensis CBS 8886]